MNGLASQQCPSARPKDGPTRLPLGVGTHAVGGPEQTETALEAV